MIVSTESEILQSGLEALKQGSYQDAIELLEKFCQYYLVAAEISLQKQYIQAQMGLVKAYHYCEDTQKAIALCQQLASNENPQVQAWVQRVLPSLSVDPAPAVEKPRLTSEQATELLKSGNKALKYKRYAEAVQALEEFCQGTAPDAKDYSQAQMWLVKAYKGNEQLEKAQALCQQLTTSKQEVAQIWARQFLLTLLPEGTVLPTATSEPTVQIETEPTTNKQPQSIPGTTPSAVAGMKMKSLSEFKNFCQQNLISELKALEADRKTVLRSIMFVSIIVFIIVSLLIKFFPFDYFNFSAPEVKYEVVTIYQQPSSTRTHELSPSDRAHNQKRLISRPSRLKSTIFTVFLFTGGLIACLWLWVAFYTSATETYASGFKSNIIEKLVDFINTERKLNYFSSPSASETEHTMYAFQNSQLFQSLLVPNKINQNSCISGSIGEVKIFLSEISAEFEIQHYWTRHFDILEQVKGLSSSYIPSFIIRRIIAFMLPFYVIFMLAKLIKSAPYVITRVTRGRRINYKHFTEEVLNNRVSRKSIFKGLFFRANFNKNLQGKTVIIPQLLNSNIHALNLGKRQAIKLEDPEFAKLFTVYGDDQVEARYILSANLMSKLVSFKKKAGKNLYISFVDNTIYIAIEYAEDLFEPKLFKTMLSFAPMREYFENLQLMFLIVEDLNLNRRIWKRRETQR